MTAECPNCGRQECTAFAWKQQTKGEYVAPEATLLKCERARSARLEAERDEALSDRSSMLARLLMEESKAARLEARVGEVEAKAAHIALVEREAERLRHERDEALAEVKRRISAAEYMRDQRAATRAREAARLSAVEAVRDGLGELVADWLWHNGPDGVRICDDCNGDFDGQHAGDCRAGPLLAAWTKQREGK